MVGYDDPVRRPEDDDLDRWRLALTLYRVACDPRLNWSIRVGLFGKWGEGKTSILRFIEKMGDSDGHLVVWFNPSAVYTLDELWTELLANLVNALQSREIRTEGLSRARRKLTLRKMITPLDRFAQITKATSAISGGAKVLLSNMLKEDGATLASLSKALPDKRVIVLIDDLDRTDPALIPALFLALRDILDAPHFSFVLAFDKRVIEASLRNHNPAWMSGSAFLDKIIDFPFSIPTPTLEQSWRLLNRHCGVVAEIVPDTAFAAVKTAIPRNPRTLKLLLRKLYSMKYEIQRHDSDELNWPIVLIFLMISLESEEALHYLRKEKAFGGMGALLSESLREGDFEKKSEEKIARVLNHFPSTDELARDRLAFLANEVHKHTGAYMESQVDYQATFYSLPHSITWKEFRTCLTLWKETRSIIDVDSWVRSHSKLRTSAPADIAADLYETASKYYNVCLEKAANSTTSADHDNCVEEALATLSLLEHLFAQGLDCMPRTFFQTASRFQMLLTPSLYWINFRVNRADQKAREAEEIALKKCLSLEPQNPEEFLEAVAPWESEHFHSDLKRELKGGLAELLEPWVAALVLEKFGIPGWFSTFYAYESDNSIKYVMFRPESLLLRDKQRQRFLNLISEARKNGIIHANCIEYLKLIVFAITRGVKAVSFDEAKELLTDEELIAVLWRAVTAQQIQYRMLHDIREIRKALILHGFPGEGLPSPAWLTEARNGEDGSDTS